MLTRNRTSSTVSWTAVTGTDPKYAIVYVVRYSADNGTETDPPSDAMKRSGITDTSTTLTGLQSNTTNYYVWVAAEILGAGVQGPYSMRTSIIAYSGNERLTYNLYNMDFPALPYMGLAVVNTLLQTRTVLYLLTHHTKMLGTPVSVCIYVHTNNSIKCLFSSTQVLIVLVVWILC